MFQYALGRHLAKINKTELKLDLSFLEDRTPRVNFTHRNYELHHFNITASIANNEDFKRLTYIPVTFGQRIRYKLLRRVRPYVYVEESSFRFNEPLLSTRGNIMLKGYWQSEKYFKAIESIIRREYTVKQPLTGVNLTWARQIQACNAISLHIRRGDYVSNAATNQFHGTCSLSYYQRAIDLLVEKVTNPVFFVFSDNPEWTQSNLNLTFPTHYVTNNLGATAYEDLRLMSLCQHHVIANSSFSWWGAWLNSSHQKTVIAPSKWFNDSLYDTADLIPENWQQI